jgi:hypothetical protein
MTDFDGDDGRGAVRAHATRLGPATRAAAILLAGWLLLGPHAAAHPDAAVVDAPLSLAPGETRAFPMSVHYHRLVATYRVAGAGSVTLEVRPGAA